MLRCRDEVLGMTKELVGIASIVNTDGEKRLAEALYGKVAAWPYFKQHPSHVLLAPTIADERERYNVMAFVKGTKGSSQRTVILMGHLDTVGVNDFGQLKSWAHSPDDLMERLRDDNLPDSIKEQLDSGDWLFGRGVLDMKSGVASNLYLLNYYSQHPEELDGTIVFLAACDEEDSSNGVRSALDVLNRWKTEHGFHYAAAINADFVSPEHEQDDNRYVYKGTIGKLLPTFFITGAETHVGSPFEGLDPNYIAAELTKQISYNPDLCDEAYGEVTVPPVSLKQSDRKPNYTVQTALSAFVYYNFFVHSWSPNDVLIKLKEQASIAFDNALADLEKKHKAYRAMCGEMERPLPWKTNVLTYKEMEERLIEEHGDEFIKSMEEFKQKLLQDDELDTRLFAVSVVEEAWKWMTDKRPAIILFYSSLYSPSTVTDEGTEEGKELTTALDEAIAEIGPAYAQPIVPRHFFPHISDMSFVSMNDDEAGIQAIANNNPAWGSKHYVRYESVRQLNVPVINIGPYGMDAHKRLERTEMTYSFDIVPNLTKRVLEKMLG
ncbi:M20/M25/M40 family metallo-hydrolase [Lentibacillus lipolyticus]|nr:M20/M25/M40 family metallo-hydrolase [Lentibacillus lipolyticus]